MHTLSLDAARLEIPLDDWLGVLKEEYLDDYLQSGGSSVKFVSGPPQWLGRARERIASLARDGGYFTAHLDPAIPDAAGKKPDVHRIDRFFFAATAGADWRGWSAANARRYFESRGISLTPGRSLQDLEGIAQDNGRDAQDLLNQFQREFATPIVRDHRMAYEFRSAITALARAQVMTDAVSPTTEEVLLGWLAGRTMPGASAALKKIHIFDRITASNARHMLESFCRWLPQTGHRGLVVTLDFRPYEHKRVARSRRQAETLARVREATQRGATPEEIDAIVQEGERDPGLTYSDPAYIQMLALLRRFIDEIDWFERLLLVVLTSPAFYDDNSPRHFWDYDALQTRIGQEVHDTRRANPAAALVHLGGRI